MLKNRLMKVAIAVVVAIEGLTHSCFAAGLEDLTYVNKPKKVAPGIWKVVIGDMSKEVRYTDLAAAPPRMEALQKKCETPYPFAHDPISFYKSPDNRIMIRIPTGIDESVFGFGLQLDGIKKSQKALNLRVDHAGPNDGRAHAPVPFYISSKGYGVFFNTARYIKAYVQTGVRKDSAHLPTPIDRNPMTPHPKGVAWTVQPDSDAVEAQLVGNGMEVLIFTGESLVDIVSRYNLYNGGGAMPPLWGLGFWNRTKSRYNAQDCEGDIKLFEDNKFPLDVIGLEPGWMTMSYPCTFEWQKERFPDPAAFSKKLLEKGIRLNLWENPYISPTAKLYKKMYPLSGSHTVWCGLVPDYTMPEARKLLAKQHQEDHISIGVSGYKIDEVDGLDSWLWPDHATFPSGTSGETMRQTYGVLLQKLTYNDLFKKNNQRTYGLVRASNAGASGYPYVIYSDLYDHAQFITGISTASLSGVLWTPEVRQAQDDREWLNRIQTVCFSPMAMINAYASGKRPWDYKNVADDVRKAFELRMRLLPYLYTAFSEYNRNGVPPMRAMILEEGIRDVKVVENSGKLDDVLNPYEQVKVVEMTDQFMFGPSILVAPFYSKQHSKRTVVLPRGNWYDFYTGKLVGNNQTITVEVTDGQIPLYVKDGAVIPMLTESVMNTSQAYGKDLEIRHYGTMDGTCELYEDDGKTFDYEKGVFSLRKINVSAQKQSGTVQQIKSDSPAMFGSVKAWTFMTKN